MGTLDRGLIPYAFPQRVIPPLLESGFQPSTHGVADMTINRVHAGHLGIAVGRHA